MAYAIILDVACLAEETSSQEAITKVIGDLPLQHEVVQEHGPAGGWPVVKFVADEREDLHRLLERYLGDTDQPGREDELTQFKSAIVPA